jgi:hypothetical protein
MLVSERQRGREGGEGYVSRRSVQFMHRRPYSFCKKSTLGLSYTLLTIISHLVKSRRTAENTVKLQESFTN